MSEWVKCLHSDYICCDIERGDLGSFAPDEQTTFEATLTWHSDFDGVYAVSAWKPHRGGWRRLKLSADEEIDLAKHIEWNLQR